MTKPLRSTTSNILDSRVRHELPRTEGGYSSGSVKGLPEEKLPLVGGGVGSSGSGKSASRDRVLISRVVWGCVFCA